MIISLSYAKLVKLIYYVLDKLLKFLVNSRFIEKNIML
jgi:hypothetical protein